MLKHFLVCLSVEVEDSLGVVSYARESVTPLVLMLSTCSRAGLQSPGSYLLSSSFGDRDIAGFAATTPRPLPQKDLFSTL